MSKQKSLGKNAFFNLIKSSMNILFPVIAFPYASRILMPEGIGKVNFANSITDYFTLIAGLGLTTYAAREASKIRDDKEKLSKFAKEIFSFNIISTIFSYILLAICFLFIEKFFEYKELIIVCVSKILFVTIGFNWLFEAKEEYRYIAIRHTLFQVISLFLLFVFVRKQGDYIYYAGIGVFSNVGANILNFFYARKFLDFKIKAKIELKKHIKPVFTFFGIQCATKINQALDAVMLGFLVNDKSVGLYSAAAKLSKLVIDVINSVIETFMPRSSYYLENGKIDEYKKMIENVCSAVFFFSFPAAAGLFVLCEPLIIIFSGKEFLPAVPAMRLLTIGIIGYCAKSFMNEVIIVPQRKEKFTLIAQIIATIFNITFNFFFIKKLEVFGAAFATLIVEFILPIVILFPSLKYLKSKNNFLSIVKAFFGSIIMMIVVYFISNHFEKNWLKLLISIPVGIFVYLNIELILKNKTVKMFFEIVIKKVKK